MSSRILRIAVIAVVAAAFSACSNPVAPSGKVPSTKVLRDYTNPNG
ncbi:MAG: hypothetical protein ACT4R6_00930 [Gemmatimonadaceae bacterium]